MVESGIHLIKNGTLHRKINTGRKNGFTERQRWSQTRDKGHLCTPLTRDKCSSLPAVSGESSGDKSGFCNAFNPYLWRASKVYLISIVKYVWDLRQRCGKKRGKIIMSKIKVKGLPKVWSNGVDLKLKTTAKGVVKYDWNSSQSLNKVLPNIFVFFPPLASRFSLVSCFAWIPHSPRASRECGVIASLGS